MTEGKWKIRQNNDWAVNYGDTGLDGALDAGGDDIPVTAGTYLVTVNFNDNTYTILEDSYGIVGSATENGWDGPDVPFTPDYCNEGLYYAYNVTLVDGLIKFRRNNQWDENYGDDGDGVLEPGGPDIPVAAGVYDFVLDLTNPSVPTYTLTEVN